MIRASAPGKLFISGEWAILELGNPGIVAAVNKRVHALIEKSDEISISIDDFNIKNLECEFDGRNLVFQEKIDEIKDKLQFIKEAIETVLRFLKESGIELKPFKIRTWGEETQLEVNGKLKKVGFGSSSAAVVATIAGILKFHGIDVADKKDLIYKLSTIAHYFAQGKVGSAFDIAASTYGGIFIYKRFDPDWLIKKIEGGEQLKNIVEEEWPGFYVEKLNIPDNFILLIAWTKESASTSTMIRQMNEYKKNNRKEYDSIIHQISLLVSDLIEKWKNSDKENISQLLRKNEALLCELGKKSGVNIETSELRMLSNIANKYGAAGKLSGAGGGDCGIAICFDKGIAKKVAEEWKNTGLYPIDASIDYEGVKIT